MLNSLRGYATGWVAQLLMGLLVLSFGAWGVNDVFNGFHSGEVALVGSTPITALDFQRDYQQAVESMSQQFGQALTPEQAQRFGVPGQVLGRLVSQATLDNAAGGMGVGVSDGELSKRIAANPQFVGADGSFDRNAVSAYARQAGYTEDAFVLSQRQQLIRSQLAQAFAGSVSAPTAYLHAVNDYQGEERAISYLVLTAPPATDIADPTDTDLNTYFEANKAQWKAPELRALHYFTLTPIDVAPAEEVSDADAQKAYDSQKARFTTPEKRRVEQIVFANRAEADAAAASLAAGKTFDALVQDRNLKPTDVDLGQITKDKIVDTAVADAAFSLSAGSVSPVIDGTFGLVIVYVTDISPEVVTTFDAAKADLKKEIATQRGATEVAGVHDTIEDARAGGSTLAEIASKYSVKLITLPAVDSDGKDANGDPVPNLPNGLVAAAFQSDVDLENDPIQPDASTYVWYEVTGLTAPRERTLAEVHDKVVAAWKDAERTKRLDQTAATAKQRLDNKEDMATVASSLGATVKTAKVTRSTKPADDLSQAAITSAFTGPEGMAVTAAGAQPMTELVLHVDTVTTPAFDQNAATLANSKQTLDTQFVNAFLNLYINQLQSQTKVTFNNNALQQVLGQPDTATN